MVNVFLNDNLSLNENKCFTESKYEVEIYSEKEGIWRFLGTTTIIQGVASFLETLRPMTRSSYKVAFHRIFDLFEQKNLLSRQSSLQTFALCNLENLLDCIHTNIEGAEATRQNRCSAFISFTKYLNRTTGGMIRTAKPLRNGYNATFRKIRDKCTTKILTHEQVIKFLNALKILCWRDYLIAMATLQGAKRISEVLNAKIESIDWFKNCITYAQSKCMILEKTTTIYYSSEFMLNLKKYLQNRASGFVFLSRSGKALTSSHMYRSFAHASWLAGVPFRVHPHVLRATCITLLMKMGYHSDDIMRVSGHTNPSSVIYYDKRPEEDNITSKVKIC